jgi:hypothetical protein
MRTTCKSFLLLIALLLMIAPGSAWAYSYGDPNQEDVAETFKLVVSSIGAGDWGAAKAAYEARRSEIASHFGEAVAVTLDQNFGAEDRALVEANFKAVLIMNLDRRFDYAQKEIGDYAQAKLLLAKAKATFETLKPYMDGKLSSAVVTELEGHFETALQAIGNPGLFGVGKEESDPEKLKTSVTAVYAAVKPLFPYTAAKAQAKPEAEKPAPSKTVTQPVKPAAEPTVEKRAVEKPAATKPAANDSAEPSVQEPKPTTAEPVAEAPDADAATPDEQTVKADESVPAAVEAEPAASEGGEAIGGANAGAEAPENVSATDEASENDAGSAPPDEEGAALAAEGHAPMAQTDKTNPVVTLSVIGGVLVLGGAGIWWARKRGVL